MAAGLRFHLAEDRIREFLMGESLYGDPTLAVRELYQNALDACRLAEARRAFLTLPPARSSVAEPAIEFEQGFDDDGRPYVDCTDRGAGMGLDELGNAFCQAGVRASDLTARQIEAAELASCDPPVELWQNSRFGIGVMSYFMLAEAITVTTARLNRDGTVGRLLSAQIDGPAASFDVIDHGPAAVHGTWVRLWLKSSVVVSAVATLRDLVLVCPLHMTAADTRGLAHRWAPGKLNRGSSIRDDVETAVAVGGGVWWTERTGGVLSDGIWVEHPIWGLIVDLTGRDMPALTADRRRLTQLDTELVERRAVAAAAKGVESAWRIIGKSDWLASFSVDSPCIADAIVAAAASRNDRSIRIHGVDCSVKTAGFMPGDEAHGIEQSPDSVLRWRFSRHREAGLYARAGISGTDRSASDSDHPVEPARPSDAVLLGTIRQDSVNPTSPWFPTAESIYDAERMLGYSVAEIVARATDLGLPLPPDANDLPASSDVVRAALSRSRRVDARGNFRAISAFEVLQVSWQMHLTTSDVVADLQAHSLTVADAASTLASFPPSTAVLVAASWNGDGMAPWSSQTQPLGLPPIVAASSATGESQDEILAGLRALGYEDLPHLHLRGHRVTDQDLVLLSRKRDGYAPIYDIDHPIPPKRLAHVARHLGLSEEVARSRLAEFGVSVGPSRPEARAELAKRDVFRLLGLSKSQRKNVSRRQRKLISAEGDAFAPWLDPRRPVPAWLVAVRAIHGRSIDAILADYARLGYAAEDPRLAPFTPTPGAA